MNLDTEALTIAEHLGIGSTRRTVCPVCHGGDKRETTWVVGREADRVWYKCFRATCQGATGLVGSHTLSPAIQAERSRALERVNPYTRPILPLTDEDRQYFEQRFELDMDFVGHDIQATQDDEYVLAVRGPHRGVRGRVVRQPVWKGVPKAPRKGRQGYVDDSEFATVWKPMPKTVLYPESTQPMLAWYRPRLRDGSGHLVLVEDQISALKVAQQGVDSVALLGNGLNVEMVRDIIRRTPRVVTIALDPGAEGQAQNLAKKWGLYFEKARVVMLEADPKDIPAQDLISELGF